MQNLKKAIKRFLKSKDISIDDFEAFASEKGLDIPQMQPKDNGDRKQCAREGCSFLRHTKQGHEFCCNKCKEGKDGHGKGC